MPAIPKPVLTLKIVVGTQAGGYINLLYYEPPLSGPTTSAQMQAIAAAAFATFAPLYSALLNINCTIFQVIAEFQSSSLSLVGISAAAPVAGVLANQLMPDQNAVCLRKLTNLPGRSNAGRWFIGGLDSGVINGADSDEISDAQLPLFQALVAAMVSDQTFDAFLFHARHWNRKTSTLEVIVEGQVASRFATQRARRRHARDYGE